MLKRDEPLAIYMEGATTLNIGKMGFGILRYSANPIACVIDSEQAGRDAADVTNIPRSAPIVATVREAIEKGGGKVEALPKRQTMGERQKAEKKAKGKAKAKVKA